MQSSLLKFRTETSMSLVLYLYIELPPDTPNASSYVKEIFLILISYHNGHMSNYGFSLPPWQSG